MAVPKRRTSKCNRDKRRTHDKVASPNVTACPQCGEYKLPHRICPSCGVYKGKEVLEVE